MDFICRFFSELLTASSLDFCALHVDAKLTHASINLNCCYTLSSCKLFAKTTKQSVFDLERIVD